MIGFEWTAAKFFWYLFFAYFTLLYFTFYAIASIVSSGFYAIWNLFSGFIIRPAPSLQLLSTKVPIWWRWYCWICPEAGRLYGLVVSQFGDVMTPMDDGNRTVVVSQFVEDYFGFKHSWLGRVAAVVVAFAVRPCLALPS
ncbi:ABC transporter G family member 36-like [Miscanthus floridulus]|uniref:ABC transporter G family member 36-like n=1 Tax=Miscanthus floridulus TaxID=154761 RepID=UPI00345AA935